MQFPSTNVQLQVLPFRFPRDIKMLVNTQRKLACERAFRHHVTSQRMLVHNVETFHSGLTSIMIGLSPVNLR
jgi:hypothetical protein